MKISLYQSIVFFMRYPNICPLFINSLFEFRNKPPKSKILTWKKIDFFSQNFSHVNIFFVSKDVFQLICMCWTRKKQKKPDQKMFSRSFFIKKWKIRKYRKIEILTLGSKIFVIVGERCQKKYVFRIFRVCWIRI